MSDESAEFKADEQLHAIGKVPAPERRVVDDAREVLWSAVAREMLGLGPAGQPRTTTTSTTERAALESPPSSRRKDSSGIVGSGVSIRRWSLRSGSESRAETGPE
jgi:hypothetical protein